MLRRTIVILCFGCVAVAQAKEGEFTSPIGYSISLRGSNESTENLKRRAEGGDAMAQIDLVMYYYKNAGVNKDRSEAVKWWRKAAEQGYAEAQYLLGLCYATGRGEVERDRGEAMKWFHKAAEQGHEKAIEALEQLGLATSPATK